MTTYTTTESRIRRVQRLCKDCVSTITQSFKKYFERPYPKFTDVPKNVKDMWFQDFCRQQEGENFRYQELFERLYMFQSGPKKGEFVSKRSKKALLTMMTTMMKMMMMMTTTTLF